MSLPPPPRATTRRPPQPSLSGVCCLCLPPLFGAVLLGLPEHEVVGIFVMQTWIVPVAYLMALRHWRWASMVSGLLGLLCLAGVGLVYLIWLRTGCLYGLILSVSALLLGGSATVAALVGLICAGLARRRGTSLPALWIVNCLALLISLPIFVRTLVQVS